MSHRSLCAALAGAASVFALAVAAQDAPVRDVTLFEAGLAELVRETGDAPGVTLRVPLRDVDDVLKSLLVRGTGIDRARMVLDGPDPIADAFAALPFPPEAATDLETLLRTVPGLRVSVRTAGGLDPREGQVMEVSETCSDAAGCVTEVTVLHDDGAIRRWPLDGSSEIAILDPEIQDALRRGLGALRAAASGDSRSISVMLEGEGVADGALTYVVSAPAWKTAYRAVLGDDVRLQAWAVIENATGEDWTDVRLTLSSGTPRTIRADLFSRDWRAREELKSDAALDAPVMAEAFDMEGGAMARLAPEPAPPAEIVAATSGEEGYLDSRFTFDAPVDLAAGQMLSMPFLAEALETERLLLWRGGLGTRAGSPEAILRIENDLPVRLPPGIMTVSDEDGGYVGDAAVPLVAPGETREVGYGQDRGIRVAEATTAERRRLTVRVAEGAVRVRSEDRRTARYAVTVQSGEAETVTIDHPVEPGWTSMVAAPEGLPAELTTDAAGATWLRARLDVPASTDGPAEERTGGA